MNGTEMAIRGVAVMGVLAIIGTVVLVLGRADTTLVVGIAGLASSCASGLIGYASHQ